MCPAPEKDEIPQKLYDHITRLVPIASVEAMIVENKCFLFLRRNNKPAKGEWWFPGGRIRRGESLEQTLRREIKEETGLELSFYKLINVYSRVFPERHDIAIAYLCECEKGNVKVNGEHSEYRYFKTAPEGLHPYMLEVIKDALRVRL
jgi:GDP-mannose mannosyl hydrolase